MVADSFVTAVEQSIDLDSFVDYLDSTKNKNSISISDILTLFKKHPSHTRNFADKLFMFDEYSAITTTGLAYINQKEIKDIVKSIATEMQVDKSVYYARDVEDVIKEFCDKIKVEIVQHLKERDFGDTAFIFSHFNRKENKPQAFHIQINQLTKGDYDISSSDIITYQDRSYLKILTDGQSGFVERLIFGSLYKNVTEIKKQFIDYILKTFKPNKGKKKAIIDYIKDFEFLRETVQDDVFSLKFRELSLQEAVDLAALLVKITMDIQVYTEKVPTVGGLIRLAIISKEKGFEWISGNKIASSKII